MNLVVARTARVTVHLHFRDDFSEAKHPRGQPGNAGQFASTPKAAEGAVVAGLVSKALKNHGYEKKKGTNTFKHKSSGAEVEVHAAKEGQKWLTGWTSKHGETNKTGSSHGQLAKHLTQLHGSSESENKPVTTNVEIKHPSQVVTNLMDNLNATPVKEHPTTVEYKLPKDGGTVKVDKKSTNGKFEWVHITQNGKVTGGSGTYPLMQQVQGLGSSTEGGTTPTLKLPGAAKYPTEQLAEAFFISGSEPATTYKVGGEKDMKVYVGNKTDHWVIMGGVSSSATSQVLKSGTGQTSLNAAFEELHPRGAGGKFIGKPHPDVAVTKVLEEAGATYVSGGNGELYEYKLPDGAKVTLTEGQNPSYLVYNASGDNLTPGTTSGNDKLAGLLKSLTSSPTSQPPGPVTLASLNKVGPQLGSNPGGQYEDPATGKRFYVKKTQSVDHARNENLAAALYQLTGAGTLKYQKPTDDDSAVVTEMVPLHANNVSGLTNAQKTQVKLDFATHAWLANWDAVGLSGDNLGAAGPTSMPINLDLGGSLKYRAKGGLKPAFNESVTEWDTLRDPAKNPQAAALFKDMTLAQLKQSVDRVYKVTPIQIQDAVKAAGYEGKEATDLGDKLVARRADLIAKLGNELNKSTSPVAPPSKSTFVAPFEATPYDSAKMSALNKAAPGFNGNERDSVVNYTGGGYKPINKALRYGYHAGGDTKIENVTTWLDKASLPHETVVYRRVSSEYASFLKDMASHPGAIFTDLGFASTSLDPGVWQGDVQMAVKLPKGAKAAAVQHVSQHKHEREVLVQRGSRFRVTGFNKAKNVIYCELDQNHLVTL